MEKIIVTGFLPFGPNGDNPSKHVAEYLGSLGYGHLIFPVEYKAVDSLLGKVSGEDTILLFGLAAKREVVTLERFAFNEYGNREDEAGMIREGQIEEGAPRCLSTSIDIDGLLGLLSGKGIPASPSEDPGRYLCNYAYFRCLDQCKGKALFVHLPPLEKEDPVLPLLGKTLLEGLLS